MSEPSVLCVMLTADRHEMSARAVRSFHSQTYGNKHLCVLHAGNKQAYAIGAGCELWMPSNGKLTIGELRNFANGHASKMGYDIICHWDDDDWSHPRRIEEQVALLQASGKEAVGYRDLLFWRTESQHERAEKMRTKAGGWTKEALASFGVAWPPPSGWLAGLSREGEAWLYSNNDPRYCVGTSLMYKRSSWERRPFQALPRNSESSSEDNEWIREVSRVGALSIWDDPGRADKGIGDPRMIASIHGSNTMKYEMSPHNWKRVPEYDEHCRKVMAL